MTSRNDARSAPLENLTRCFARLSCAGALMGSTLAGAADPAAGATSCQAQSGAQAPVVLELYTSEGCSSCPPADRWLSSLKGRTDVLPMAFHVTYWDRLGWPDRFALPEGTARQHELAQVRGSRQVYTPQVVANGQDWPAWHRDGAWGKPAASPLSVLLKRDGDRVSAVVSAAKGSSDMPPQLTGYWAVLEDQHVSRVRAGENAGNTLLHDHVVRLYQPVPAWRAGQGSEFVLTVGQGVPAHLRRVIFVVSDPATLRPLQAVSLGC